MGAPVQKLQKAFGRFSSASGITKLAKGFGDLGRGSLSAFRNVARVVDPLAAITGAASIAGMVKLTEAWADFGSQLGFTAQRLGITASALQSFQGGARLAGSSASSLASGMQTLGQNMYNAVGGRAPEITAGFQYLHLSFQNVNGSARSVSEMLPEIADKIKGISDPFAQAAVATALFGGAGEDLLPFLRLGSAGIAKYNAEARRYGVLNAAGVTAANNMRMAQVSLSLAVQGLGNSIAQRLAPVIDPLLGQMSEWIARNRDWIATGIGKAVQDFATWLMAVNWQQVGQGIMNVASAIGSIVGFLGRWGKAAPDLAIFMGGSWLASMLIPFATIAASIAGITSSLVALPLLAAATAAALLIAFKPDASGTTAQGTYGVLNGHPTFIPTTGAISETTGGYVTQGGRQVYRQTASAAAGVRNQGMNYFMSQGWSKAHAAAIMGNVQAESSFNPNADSVDRNTGLHHRGLFQDDPSRWAKLTSLYGPNPTAIQQFQFAQSELMGSEKATALALNNSPDAMTGAMAFDTGFERSGDDYARQQSRGANALFIGGMSSYGPAANIGDGSAGAGGTASPAKVTIDLNHTNPPDGTTATVSSNSPNVTVGKVKITKSLTGHGL